MRNTLPLDRPHHATYVEEDFAGQPEPLHPNAQELARN